VAELIGLLVTFIGTAMTLQLLHDAWPDADFSKLNLQSKGAHAYEKTKEISAHQKKAASATRKVTLRQLPTGVRGLDEILGGGIPNFLST